VTFNHADGTYYHEETQMFAKYMQNITEIQCNTETIPRTSRTKDDQDVSFNTDIVVC